MNEKMIRFFIVYKYNLPFSADTKVDPSLQERQRQLKRARLQDSLSDRLANRPGPLELIERKILQADGELTDAIEGNDC